MWSHLLCCQICGQWLHLSSITLSAKWIDRFFSNASFLEDKFFLFIPVQLWSFNQSIRITISNETVAKLTAKTFRMEIVITSDHNWTSDDLEIGRSWTSQHFTSLHYIFNYSLHHTVDMIHQIWSNNRSYKTAAHLFRNTNSIIVHHMLSNGNIQRAIRDLMQICILHRPIRLSSWNIQVLGFLL